jgi:hypothetical protein
MATSSTEVGRDENVMQSHSVSAALRDRLGREGTSGLLELLESERTAWSDHVPSLSAERYERRLTEEIADCGVALVREIYDLKADMLKWTFLFCVGQLEGFAGLLAFMLCAGGR